MERQSEVHGGDLVADVLVAQGVPAVFTLCGGHISPILIAAKRRGLLIADVRDEKNAVFAADAMARLTGVPGVVAVTAGPGLTNTITAVKNAQLAQSPLVVLGGATATVLKGRGSLQDIDQMALMRPHVKWAATARTVRDLVPLLERAFALSRSGVPGPVFVEIPVDLLYPESLVRQWYLPDLDKSARDLGERLLRGYLQLHLKGLFSRLEGVQVGAPQAVEVPEPVAADLKAVARLLDSSLKPLMIVGSQALVEPDRAAALAGAVEALGIPVYLSGMARGLLGRDHPLQRRHKRRLALREADLVLLAGVPCDFRLDYGRHIPRAVPLVSINRDWASLRKNRRPTVAAFADPARFLIALAERLEGRQLAGQAWIDHLAARDREREAEIDAKAAAETEGINPVRLWRELEELLPEETLFVADGGDFVATASYIVRPRAPLTWLDPGVFGTLGVGAGFALGAKLARPDREVWLIYGDGSAGYSLVEWDTFRRIGIPVIAIIGNDGCWQQIAREQVEIFGDETGTLLRRTAYHEVARGYGGEGLLVERLEELPEAVAQARRWAAEGKAVVINALIGRTDFRKGSISM